ncbi:MAG: hypothetical protein ACRDQZ_03115 [Mycobacteriales bacterium]
MRLAKLLLIAVLLFVADAAVAQAACTPGPHCTTINWTPGVQPAGVVVTGFNIYKSTSSGGYTLGTPYSTVGPTVTSFVDNTVTPGQTTFMAVTAVCATCTTKESKFSNEISGTTPGTQGTAPVLSGTWQ